MHMKHSSEGYCCILAAIDVLSRMAWAVPLRNETAQSQIDALTNSVLQFGTPRMLISDRHKVYESEEWLNWLQLIGVTGFLSPGYSSTHVAPVNRLHRTLREMLAKAMQEHMEWSRILPYVVIAYNESKHPATGLSPKEVVFGEQPWTKINAMIRAKVKITAIDSHEYLCELNVMRVRARQMAIEIQEARHKKLVDEFLERQRQGARCALTAGHRVMRMCPAVKHKEGKQLAVRYYGPYVISSVDKDGIHCMIIKETEPKSEPKKVHFKYLVSLKKDRVMVPIYPVEDLVRKAPVIPARNPIVEEVKTKNHPYNTRST